MGVKSRMTPLERLEELDEQRLQALRDFSITTVEELVGALESSPAQMRLVLKLDKAGAESLKESAVELIDPAMREAIESQRGRKHSYGALYPGDRSS